MQIISLISIRISKEKWISGRKMIYGSTMCRSYSAPTHIASGYQPKEVENGKHKKWLAQRQKDSPSPENSKGKFKMILPPPNVTGNLHLGHALMATVQDVICRQNRKLGYDVQWIPGTDHAGIATQVVVEKKLLKERSISRHQLGREKFLQEAWKWKEEKGESIIEDLQRLGCSLDWSKEYFTMDKRQENAVNMAFVELFNEGLIKRQKTLVNWSCTLESAISDIEVDTLEVNGPTEVSVPGYKKNIIFGRIYNFCYRVCNSSMDGEEIVVSTTRPETMLGDVAVAVHPDDERYHKFKQTRGQTDLWHPFRNEPIPLIFDASVDREFGTGAVKITPAHDKDDFEMAKRHSLNPIQVFTEQGKIATNFDHFVGLPRFEARTQLLDALVKQNLLRDINAHTMNLPICSRSKDVIEYMLRPQWFLKCQPMANEAMEAVRSGRIQLHPVNFQNDWFRWLGDCHDWCISRQLWWGHQIPAYLAKSPGGEEVWVAALSLQDAKKEAKKKLSSEDVTVERDSDVLDTWFSSSLLPFSAFNWPNEEFKNSYPLDLMETGHDILFFWVARMVMLGIKLTGEVPFKKVLLNGIVCDAHGRKMSKSLGNVVTPQQIINGTSIESLQKELQKSFDAGVVSSNELKMSLKGLQKMFPTGIQECGTDALRFTLCSHNIKSHFINFDVTECHTNKLFLNKIWQATRFTLGAADKLNLNLQEIRLDSVVLSTMDRWILSRLADTLEICTHSFENYNFHTAVAALKTFLYANLCDVYLETTKPGISAGAAKAQAHCATLLTCLRLGMETMSPFIPFIAEELLQHLPETIGINVTQYRDKSLEDDVAEILDICQSIRQLKSRNKISKKHDPRIHLFAQNSETLQTLSAYIDEIRSLTLSNEVSIELMESEVSSSEREHFTAFSTAGHLCSFGISTNQDFRKEKESFVSVDLNQKKMKKLEIELARYLARISSEGYRKSASEIIQKKHLEKIQQLEVEIENIKSLAGS